MIKIQRGQDTKLYNLHPAEFLHVALFAYNRHQFACLVK